MDPGLGLVICFGNWQEEETSFSGGKEAIEKEAK
jgi:hypothetical protein